MKVIGFENVSEKYRIKFLVGGKVDWEEIYALRDVTFEVHSGEVLGVIGENGAGKTTFLKLIAGMLVPDKGTIEVTGKVSALMELGAGFNPEFTGRENILINARLYGIEENSLETVVADVIEFAGLGKFIDAPIKYYSQGMYMRLAFALAISVDPDVLLIDDILAVGDEESRQKCIRKIFGLKKEGKTIVLVSHDMEMVSRLSDRVIHIEKGSIIKEGPPAIIIAGYLERAGNKAGVAVLDINGLRATINNGRLILSANDAGISIGQGAYVSFFDRELNFWSSSSNLSWHIAEVSGSRVFAIGVSGDRKVVQTWDVALLDNRLIWKVKTKGEQVEFVHMDLPVSPDYKVWMSLENEGSFPPFGHKVNWQEVRALSGYDVVLGIKPAEEGKTLPPLILKRKEGEYGGYKLLNTGYDLGSRVIQIPFSKNGAAEAEICFIHGETEFIDELRVQRERFFTRRAEYERLKRASCTISSGDVKVYCGAERKVFEIYYRDTVVSSMQGLTGTFLFDRGWVDICSAAWEVKKDEDVLNIRFSWKHPDITQVWVLRAAEGGLMWEAEYSGSCAGHLDMIKFGILLKEGYSRYFCGSQEGEFPVEFTRWRELALDEPRAVLFGAKGGDMFPAVALENKGGYECSVENSDAAAKSRVLNFVFRDEACRRRIDFSAGIRFMEGVDAVDAYIRGEREARLRREAEARERELRLRTLTSGKIELFVDTLEHCLRLKYGAGEITCNQGLHSRFSLGPAKESVLSCEGEWLVEQKNAASRTVLISHPGLFFTQIWTFEAAGENTLKFKVEFETEKEIMLWANLIKLELRDVYSSWLTRFEKGGFSNLVFIGDTAPVRMKDNRLAYLALEPAADVSLPVLSVRVLSHPEKAVAGLYKKNAVPGELLCLSLARVFTPRDGLIRKGRCVYFEGDITFGDIPEPVSVPAQEPERYELGEGKTKLIFDRGKSDIVREREKLTAGLGIFTSLRFANIWYDSCQAVWEVNGYSGKKIEAQGYWPHIPVSQSWRIETVEDGVFLWEVWIHIYEKILIELQQANIMLISEYSHWGTAGGIPSRFPEEYSFNYDILPFRLWYGRTEGMRIEAVNGRLPSVSFEYSGREESMRIVVENSDYVYRARLLQFQRSMIAGMEPGSYPYFTGVIRVSDKR
ncbi:MAG: ABC transporter ATP-binding protein [Candidatus Omnitrophota bacterium]|jgi:ABC-type polysaccharide/polyol phosphate transport system ATPase subunit